MNIHSGVASAHAVHHDEHHGHKEILITVQDRGIGIAEAEIQRIFEPFYRSSAVLEAQIHGTGLGLPVAKSIAEAMAGTLSVESQPGRGSTFTLRLPARSAKLQLATAGPQAAPSSLP